MITLKFKNARLAVAMKDANIDVAGVEKIIADLAARQPEIELVGRARSKSRGALDVTAKGKAKWTTDTVAEANAAALLDLDDTLERMADGATYALGDFALSENVLVDLPQVKANN